MQLLVCVFSSLTLLVNLTINVHAEKAEAGNCKETNNEFS